MYGVTFYGHHTVQHQLQWRQMKIKKYEAAIEFEARPAAMQLRGKQIYQLWLDKQLNMQHVA